jgi:hypothetical protein
LVAAAATVAVIGTAIGVVVVRGGPNAAPSEARASIPSACATKLLGDWYDGRIEGTYPIRCYRSALASLPADLQVYSSAADDIAQALSERIVQSARKGKPVRKLAGGGARAK